MGVPPSKRVTLEEFLPLVANGEPFELVDGELVRKANPTPEHGYDQAKIPDAYLVVLTAQRGDVVRAEPFGEIELELDELLGLT